MDRLDIDELTMVPAAVAHELPQSLHLPGQGEIEGILDDMKDQDPSLTPNFVKARATLSAQVMPAARQHEGLRTMAAQELIQFENQRALEIGKTDQRIGDLDQVISRAKEELGGLRQEFGQAMAGAKLTATGDTPASVEDAIRMKLNLEAPRVQDTKPTEGWFRRFLRYGTSLATIPAGLVSGVVLSVALGSMTGLLDVTDIEEISFNFRTLVACSLGPIAIFLIGGFISMSAVAIARARDPITEADWKLVGPAKLAIMLISFIWLAEIVAEAFGLKIMYDALRDSMLTDGLPPIEGAKCLVFVIAAGLTATPYLLFKLASSYYSAADKQQELREKYDDESRQRTIDMRVQALIHNDEQAARAMQLAFDIQPKAEALRDLEADQKQVCKRREELDKPSKLSEATKEALARARGQVESGMAEIGRLTGLNIYQSAEDVPAIADPNEDRDPGRFPGLPRIRRR